MTDPKKTEELLLTHEQQTARLKYEALLNSVLDEVHSLVDIATETDPALTGTIDDSKIHVLVQRLRDEFEVSA